MSKNISDHILNLSSVNEVKGFKIVALNIRSLLPKIDLIRLELKDVKLDALVFNETWLKPIVDSGLIKIDDLQCIRADRSVRNAQGDIKSGGGICVHYSNKYIGNPIAEFTNCDDDLETLCVILKCSEHTKVVILGIYRPPSGSIPNAISRLNQLCEQILGLYTTADVYIIGDFNVNLLDSSNYALQIKELCANHSLFSLVNRPTRHMQNCQTQIDICLTNCVNIVKIIL